MADFSYSDDLELRQLNDLVMQEPDEYEHWEKLIRAAETQEGGLNRNSNPQAIASTRDTYDRFLARFPLFFGYWKKYADFEFSIAGTEAAEMVYERGVASIGTSVDLWANYCTFKTETSHDIDLVRELFERGADSCGLDFQAHPFWDKYLEYEERLDAGDKIFDILSRIVQIPMHQYARYFERYRTSATRQPVIRLASEALLASTAAEVQREHAASPLSDVEIEREIRERLDAHHMQIFQRTQDETSKRWTYEQEIRRPYFHVTELDDPQLENWRKYLSFEELEGDYQRIQFLYERCLVTAANYDEFWLRYSRWMRGQSNKVEEVRNIFLRASCFYVPISKPTVRLRFANYEESLGRPTVAADIYGAILSSLPGHLETIVALARLRRRQDGVPEAIQTLRQYIDDTSIESAVRGALVSEWAQMVFINDADVEAARKIYKAHADRFLDCSAFWTTWFNFEVRQYSSGAAKGGSSDRVKAVFNDIRFKAHLPEPVLDTLVGTYMDFLLEHGGADAVKEYMDLDRDVYGPPSVRADKKGVAVGAVVQGSQKGANGISR